MVVRAGIDQEETESSDLKKRKKEEVCRILRFWLIMTISCFRTFLIFIQSYIFLF